MDGCSAEINCNVYERSEKNCNKVDLRNTRLAMYCSMVGSVVMHFKEFELANFYSLSR